MGTTTKKWDRKFLGKLFNFSSKEEKNRENKHLKAYLRGYEQFTHGFREIEDPVTKHLIRVPHIYPVLQSLTPVN